MICLLCRVCVPQQKACLAFSTDDTACLVDGQSTGVFAGVWNVAACKTACIRHTKCGGRPSLDFFARQWPCMQDDAPETAGMSTWHVGNLSKLSYPSFYLPANLSSIIHDTPSGSSVKKCMYCPDVAGECRPDLIGNTVILNQADSGHWMLTVINGCLALVTFGYRYRA